MKHYATFPVAVVIALGLISAFAVPGYAHDNNWSYDSNSINLDHGDVIIHGKNGATARIAPDGALYIAGKPQAVSAAQRRELVRYVETVEDMRAKGLALASAAGHFAGSIVSEVLGGLFSGKSEAQIDRAAHARAHDFKQQALPICRDAQTLKRLQDSLAAGLPAFKPYAVIEAHDVDNCEHDINSDE